jgi:hypothetical protein
MRSLLLLTVLLWGCSDEGGKDGDSAASAEGADGTDGGEDGGAGDEGTGEDGGDGGGDEGSDDGEEPIDADGDGYPAEDDCDDDNAAVNPGAAEVEGDGLDNDCNPETCLGAGFGPASHHALPSGYGALTFLTPGAPADCDRGREGWGTQDLDGDGHLDAVIASTPCGEGERGQVHWDVHLGSAAGFSATATTWALPPGFAAGAFSSPQGRPRNCEAGQPRWILRDMQGDGLPDIVLMAHCDEPDVGVDHWWVYQNTGAGFSATPTEWALPTGYATGTFYDPGSAGDCGSGVPAWGLGDLDGGGRPDIVIRRDACNTGEPGVAEWWVHDNDGTGAFASTPLSWALPAFPAGTFYGTNNGGDCPAGIPAWNLSDIDGDGLQDVVVTWLDCEDEVVGTERWDVYRGSTAGFSATASPWSLPEGYGTGAFSAIAAERACDVERPRHQLVDLDGSGRPAIVVMMEPCTDGDVGLSRWLIHPPDGDGFSSTTIDHALPAGYPSATFEWPGSERSCSEERPGWNLLDIDGDGPLDAVVTASACLDDEVGATLWAVHHGGCNL